MGAKGNELSTCKISGQYLEKQICCQTQNFCLQKKNGNLASNFNSYSFASLIKVALGKMIKRSF